MYPPSSLDAPLIFQDLCNCTRFYLQEYCSWNVLNVLTFQALYTYELFSYRKHVWNHKNDQHGSKPVSIKLNLF